MKKICPIILVFVCSFAAVAQTVDSDSLTTRIASSFHDQMFAPDKGHHLMASAFLAGFSFYALRQEFDASESAANSGAIGLSLSIGIAKEIYDGVSGKGTPSFKDIIADAAGIAAAILILNLSSE